MSKESLNESRREFERAIDEHVERHGRNARIYISGPMTDPKTGDVSNSNLLAFWEAEKLLRERGFTRIVNPVRVWACKFPWLYRIVGYRLTLLYDLWLLMRCDQIYKLPGWRDSKGANIESCVAYHFKIWPIPKQDIAKLDKRLAKLQEKWQNKKLK